MTDANNTTAAYTARLTKTGDRTVTAMIRHGSCELGEVTLVGEEPDIWGDSLDRWASDGVVDHLLGFRQPERAEEIASIVDAVRRALWD